MIFISELPSPLLSFGKIIITLTVGWFLYLAFNRSGNLKDMNAHASHFNPYSPLFSPKERPLIALSDIGILICISVIAYLGYQYSFLWILSVYIIPYLHVNFW